MYIFKFIGNTLYMIISYASSKILLLRLVKKKICKNFELSHKQITSVYQLTKIKL